MATAIAVVLSLSTLAAACSFPDLDTEEATSPRLFETSFLYDSSGRLITEFHAEQDRKDVAFKKIPDDVRHAVIAIEDKRFYQHDGIDARGILRAAYQNAQAGTIVQGASTITEQYVSQALLANKRTLQEKIDEAALAYQMEQKYSKEEILEKYLNTVYFGEGAYGIEAAAQRYFSRSADKLSLPQGAMLAGLISSPNTYDPIKYKKKGIARRKLVLDQMLEQGYIDQAKYSKANRGGLHLDPSSSKPEEYEAAYFVDYVKRWFLNNPRFGTSQERYDLLFGGGLKIYTTVDIKMQKYADQAVYGTLSQGGDPRGAMTVVDPRTGEIKAMVGGENFFARNDSLAQVNLATGGSTGRQAGSSFKPFILVAALENGINPSKSYPAPGCIDIRDQSLDKPWRVCNADLGSYGGSISMAAATAGSVNTYFAQLMMDVGPEKAVQVAEDMGIRCCTRAANPSAPLQAVPSAVLGAEEVNSLEMASAFGTIANGGRHVNPYAIAEIRDSDNHVLYKADRAARQVIDPKTAATAVNLLKGVISGGTGTAANIGRPQIGKTGTAQNYSDAWFVGAVPQLSAAVWVGYPEGQRSMCCTRIGTVYGGTWPAQIWRSFMSKATRGLSKTDFPKGSQRYVTVDIDRTRGCLPNKFTPPGLIEKETYLAGEEPHKKCVQPTSFGVVPVPLVVGYSAKRAVLELNRDGFEVKEYQAKGTKPFGFVIQQTPVAGTDWSTEKAIKIVVSVEKAKQIKNPVPTPEDEAAPTGDGTGDGSGAGANKNDRDKKDQKKNDEK